MESRRPETEDFRTLLPLFQLYERWHVIEHSTLLQWQWQWQCDEGGGARKSYLTAYIYRYVPVYWQNFLTGRVEVNQTRTGKREE